VLNAQQTYLQASIAHVITNGPCFPAPPLPAINRLLARQSRRASMLRYGLYRSRR
jgi:hypothetical protein